MGFIQKDALKTMVITYFGLLLGYLNKGVLFILILKTEEIGLVNLILSVGILFSQLSNLGAINAISRFLPYFRDVKDQRQSFLLLNLLFVFIGTLIFTLIVYLLHNQISIFYSAKSKEFVEYYYWIIPIGIANVFFIVFETYLRALYKNILSVFLNEFLLRFLVSILLGLLAFKLIDFEQFIIYHCLIYFLPTVILFIYLYKIGEVKVKKSTLKISKKFKQIIYSFSLFSYTNTLGSLIVLTMDSLMIAYFLGLNETGVYTTIIYLTSALQIPYKSLFKISSPLIPQYWKEKNLVKMGELYKKFSSIALIVSLFMFLIVWINIDELFSFLPSDYHSGIYIFLFLMLGRTFDMYSGLNSAILITSKKFKYDNLFTLILLFLVFGLNYWLIPIYGSVGAAISTGIALIVYNLLRLVFVWKTYRLHPLEKEQLYVFLLFCSLIYISSLIPSFGLNKYLYIILNSIVFTSIYFSIILKFRWNIELNLYLDQTFSKFRRK